LDMLGAQGQRKWCSVRFRWLRREHAVTERQEQCWIPEIPDERFLKDWDRLPTLLVTLDQASTGWGACHFLCSPGQPGQTHIVQQPAQETVHGSKPATKTVHGSKPRGCPQGVRRKMTLPRALGGMNLLMFFRGDPYHRSWNDWKTILRRARGDVYSSVVQMTAVYNHNYQPYFSGANLAKKGEFLQEFKVFFHQHDAEWQALCPSLLADGATAHGAESQREAQQLYNTLVLHNQHFVKKGTFVRSSAWYSIVEAVQHHDAGFQAWRFLLRRVARSLLKSGAKLSTLQEQAAKSMQEAVDTTDHGVQEGQTKEEHKALMQAMKKKAGPGQQIVLCPLLMHNAFFSICA